MQVQADSIKLLNSSIVETSERSKSLKIAIDNISKSQASVLSDLKKLKENSVEVKDFLNTRIPSDVNRMLKSYRDSAATPSSP